VRERYVRTIRFEKVLIDMNPGPKALSAAFAGDRPTLLSSRSRCAHALYSPLSDFGLDPSDGARSQPDGCRKTLFPDRLVA
jgi:hypothetical protein